MRKNKQVWAIFLWILLALLFVSSCSSTDKTSNIIPANQEDSEREEVIPAMAFVVDPDYNPVAYASIGTTNLLSDRYGVAIGEITANDAGWVLVQAPGYVSNYAKPSRFSGKYDLYFITLVPVEAGAFYENSSSSNLWIGDSDIQQIQIEITPGALQEDKAFLELTEINPRKISMDDFWMELDDTFRPLISFDISAYDISGKAVGLSENSIATVTIHDDKSDADDLVLQSFDSESGNWITQDDVCSRINDQMIECSLSHFSSHSFQNKNLDPEDLDSDAFKGAYKEIDKLYRESEEGQDLSRNLKDPLERLAEAARDFARRNRNEAGKAMLMYAYEIAMESGVEGSEALANDLQREAQELVAEMAEKLAENPNCGNMYELLHVMDQGMRVGGVATAKVQDLKDKVGDRFDNCEIWVGTIRYSFYLLQAFPGLEEKWNLDKSSQTWTELHQVTIGINPVTGHLDGDSYVKLNFPTASYLTEIGGGDCGPDKQYIDINTGGGSGFTWMTFAGTYDGKIFQVEQMEERESSPVEFSFHSHGLSGCPKQENDFGKIPILSYRSQLLDGFFGQPQPPSLEEMLNSGGRSSTEGGGEAIRGGQDISYSPGVNRPEMVPTNHAYLAWHIQRVPLPKK